MINREEIDELFRCLLAGAGAPVNEGQMRFEQSQQLLQAFDRIEDLQLRQELILLIEIVSKMPEVLHRKRDSWGKAKLAQFH